jgi:3D (Asp-Asp-Asp) domain-containing protein
MIEELGEIVHVAGSFFADLMARIINAIRSLAPVIVLGACQGPTVTPSPKVDHKASLITQPTRESSDEPKPIGEFNVTFYYVIGEDEIVASRVEKKTVAKVANDNAAELTSVAPDLDQDQVNLYEAGSCDTIASVSHEFASQLAIQGTGKLHDGRVLNIWGRCKCSNSPCFKVTENQWGTAGSNHPLQPFRTVAVDPKVVKLGSLLYVPLLEGRTMPGRAPWGGFVHDGCVVADDTGGHIDGHRLDLFVGRKAYFLGLSGSGSSHAWARHVPIYDGSQICERKGRRVGRKSGAI